MDEETAKEWLHLILGVHQAVHLLTDIPGRSDWTEALAGLALSAESQPLLAGLATRLLVEEGVWQAGSAAQVFSRALTGGAAGAAKRLVVGGIYSRKRAVAFTYSFALEYSGAVGRRHPPRGICAGTAGTPARLFAILSSRADVDLAAGAGRRGRVFLGKGDERIG
ncbi:MAG: hypothetical protein IPI11_08185 [Haliscomenobacter sp.]|nr:hypothetical protein [Haliscomenobacter sp.]